LSDKSEKEDSISPDDPNSDSSKSELIVRSAVAKEQDYRNYKQNLRRDFFYQCAYCSISEVEAGGLRFVIDHYAPRSKRPDLVNEYDNLMWACDACNIRKSDVFPPEEAQNKGLRYFRPDSDYYEDHFQVENDRLRHKTLVGDWSISALGLNRQHLMRLRNIRRRLFDSRKHVMRGIAALRSLPIDRLPNAYRTKANIAVTSANASAKALDSKVDQILESSARSIFLDVDTDNIAARERKIKLKEFKATYPGPWTSRNKGRPKKHEK